MKECTANCGVRYQISCHTFRATGITTLLDNGGDLETAHHITGLAEASVTKLYDWRRVLLSEKKVVKSGS